jgi:lysozyme
LKLQAYVAPEGKWAIGYGYTRPWVTPMCEISEEWAEQLLIETVADISRSVLTNLDLPLNVGLNENQLAALISFAYNIGPSAFARSTLLRFINSGDFKLAAEEFMRWDKIAGVQSWGLTRRRKAEKALFERPV